MTSTSTAETGKGIKSASKEKSALPLFPIKNQMKPLLRSNLNSSNNGENSKLVESIQNQNSNTRQESAISSVTNQSNNSIDDVGEAGVQPKPICMNEMSKSNVNKPNETLECLDAKQMSKDVHRTTCNGNKMDSSVKSEVKTQSQQIPDEMNNGNLRKENVEMTTSRNQIENGKLDKGTTSKSSNRKRKNQFCFLQVGTSINNKTKAGESLLSNCDSRIENASKKEIKVTDCFDKAKTSNVEDTSIDQQAPNESESLVNGNDDQTQPQAIIGYEPLGLNEEDLCTNDKILSEMFTWTTYEHLNKLEQEILWLVELSFSMIDKANLIQGESNDCDVKRFELSFRYIQHFMSTDLRSNFFDNFVGIDEITQQSRAINITSNSMLIRYGVRHKNPKIKIEFMDKRKEAQTYIISKIQKRHYARCLSTICTNERISSLCKEAPVNTIFQSPEINQRWFQYHDEDENETSWNEAKLKSGDLVYLFEDPLSNLGHSGENDFDFQRLNCYQGKILSHKKHTDYVTYSVLLRDTSSIEHGVVAQSIFCAKRIVSLQALCLEK